jgi:ParB-like chromosome segregation protein Spo0J
MKIAGRTATIKRLGFTELKRLPVHYQAALFPYIEGELREFVRASLAERGFDESEPIVLWAKTNEIVDGRNRRDLAVELKLTDVPVASVRFTTEDEVRAYIVQANLARRHLPRRELEQLRKRLTRGGMSTRQVASLTGASERTVQRQTEVERAAAKEERDQEIERRLAAGEPQRQVARELGVGKSTVGENAAGNRQVGGNRPRASSRSRGIAPIEEPQDTVENAAAMIRRCGVRDDDAAELLQLLVRLQDLCGPDGTSKIVLPYAWRLMELADKRDPVALFLNTAVKNGGT